MIHQKLLNPQSIVVVGASNDLQKPGGKILKNLLDGNFKGKVYAVNPKATEIQGITCYSNAEDLPPVDCAILAIAAKYCPATVKILADNKDTRGFIILSAGFSEENEEGCALEKQIVDTINRAGGTIDPIVQVLEHQLLRCFHFPIPPVSTQGVDFITGSGSYCRIYQRTRINQWFIFQ